MKEIEVKIIEVNREEIEKKLVELGAKKEFEKEFIAYYYENENTRKNGLMLRTRKEGNNAVLTLKEKSSKIKVKIAEETEVSVSDFKTINLIFEKLGFDKYLKIRKRRIQYLLGETHIVFDKFLDDYDSIPEFLEIEAKDENAVFESAKLLGFKQEDCKPWSSKDVFKHYSER